jgi:hypothetical protein
MPITGAAPASPAIYSHISNSYAILREGCSEVHEGYFEMLGTLHL